MKIKLKRLALLNIIFYINNYSYATMKATFETNSVLKLWSITPYIFFFITTFLLESPMMKKQKKLKALSWTEYIIRIASLFINYLASSHHSNDNRFIIFIGLEVILMIANIYIIIKILNEVKVYIKLNGEDDELLTNEQSEKLINEYYIEKKNYLHIGVDEREKLRRGYKTTSLTGFSLILLAIMYMNTTVFLRIGGEKYRIVFLIFDIFMMVGYFKLSSIQLKLFYKENSMYKKVFIRDNLILLAGMTFLFLVEGFIYINTNDINFITYIIGTLGLVPTLSTNKNISLNFHKVNKEYLTNSDDTEEI